MSALLGRVPRQTQNQILSEIQSEVDKLVGNAISMASDGETMTSLFAAGQAARFVRLGVFAAGRSLTPLAVQGLSHAAALIGESAVFAGMERRFSEWERHKSTQSFQQDWARALINLGSIKLLGGAAQGQNFILQHLLTVAGMVAGNHVGSAFGVTNKPEGTIAQQLIRAEGMNWGMKGSLALLHGFSPKLSAMESSIDLIFKSREVGLFSQKYPISFFPYAWAAEGNILVGSDVLKTSPNVKSENSFRMTDKPYGLGVSTEFRGPNDPPQGMVRIPGGKFRMGSEDFRDTPVSEVDVPPFFLGKTPVTNAEYRRYVEARQDEPFVLLETGFEPGHFSIVDTGKNWEVLFSRYLLGPVEQWAYQSDPFIQGARILLKVVEPKVPQRFDGPNQPVVMIHWFEASAYAAWAVKGGRLPTEAEWEYAARGPQGFEYGTRSGKLTREEAHYEAEATADVASYPPNAYGLYDMMGNVSEWTADWHPRYPGLMALRGGHWANIDLALHVARRIDGHPLAQDKRVGFRVAAPITQDSK